MGPVDSSTIAYIDRDVKSLLVLYIPIRRLLKYRSYVTYSGDVIVMDAISFHDVTDVWTAQPSPKIGWPATDPKKISSNKVVNEVACQCEYASKSVPMQVVENVMKGLIGVARQTGRIDVIIDDLEENWSNYAKSSYSGNARCPIVVARQELCPKESAKYRLCPKLHVQITKRTC